MNFNKIFNLKDKVAIITGGAGILGEVFCHGLAEYGANIVILDKNKEKSDFIADNLQKKYQIKALSIYCDVTSESQIIRALNKIENNFKRVDILINNAAGKSENLKAFFEKYENYSLDQWEKILKQNLTSMFMVSKHIGGYMANKNIPGSIIQISSIYGVNAPDHRIYEGSEYMGTSINTPAIYSATKSSVIGLTKYLATYWAKNKIRVNTLTPGGVFSGQNENFIRNYSNRVPMNRMANKNEMVGGLIFLASDASSYVTGHNLIIDGGLSCW
jgi:NAD(P)-dependent dehydrogenase (short-subunit alcohol dehydrogenase family)